MPSQLPAAPPIKPPQPIVTQGGRSFWNEAIKIVISFMAAQILLAVGLPFDDWAGALLSRTGAEISQGRAWWIAAGLISLLLYMASRSLRRSIGRAPA